MQNDNVPNGINKEEQKAELEGLIKLLCQAAATWYVQNRGHYYAADRTSAPLTQSNFRRLCLQRFRQKFPEVELTNKLASAVFNRLISEAHDDPSQAIPVWDGATRCEPSMDAPIIPDGEMVVINTWSKPAYRSLEGINPDISMLEEFLGKIFKIESDQKVVLNWLAWTLQNEADKPSWALLLYSQKKGTGKSTFCKLAKKLFGEKNSITQNSIAQLTSRFNKPILDSKLVVSEELQLKQDSPQGNMLKTFITEKVTLSERKGRELEPVKQVCCFLFTSNHLPLWIEADERRYYVIDVNHDGHASGPEAEAFSAFISELHDWLKVPANVASLYLGLMEYRVSNDFNPRSLNINQIETPIMKQIMGNSQEVVLARLSEHIAARGVFALPQEELAKFFVEDLKVNVNRIRHMMPELGWRPESAKWGGRDYRRVVWVHPDYQVQNGRALGPRGYDEPVDAEENEFEVVRL
jgi:hypothetical protein